MQQVQDGEARVRTEYCGNGRARRGAVIFLALGVLCGATVASRSRDPMDTLHVLWIASGAIGAALLLSLGSLQLWTWRHPFRLTVGPEGITLHRAGRTHAVPWDAISRVAIESPWLTYRARCLKVWPAPAVSLPRRAGARTPDGAVAVCQLNTIDGTAEELAASIRHFAPASLAVAAPDSPTDS